jgi:hypothetical protein
MHFRDNNGPLLARQLVPDDLALAVFDAVNATESEGPTIPGIMQGL